MFNPNPTVLNDKDFLKQLDEYPIHETLAKIIVLDFNEQPLGDVTGNIETGSISVDGSSACRRTCRLTLFTLDSNVNELDWQIHTKYIVAIGKRNFVNSKYPEWIWFPMGMYIATEISLTNKMQGFTISLTGKDKICLLDGSVGGALFAEHDFAHIDVITDGGDTGTEDVLIYDIIREAIHVYAKEPYENIIINDLDDVSVELLTYNVDNLYCYLYDVSSTQSFNIYDTSMCFEDTSLAQYFDTIYIAGEEGTIFSYDSKWYRIIKKLTYGETAGYRQTDLIYPSELVINAGGTIVEMLNKVVEVLGEFEFFYDLYGRFVFRRKQIYHNIVWTGIKPEDQSVGYFSSSEANQDIYDFTNSNIIESYINKPKLTNIRNDWAIWGKIGTSKNSSQNGKIACHLRYAIDDKPKAYHCLTDGYWYVVSDYDMFDSNNVNDLATIEFNDLINEYTDYVKSFWYEDSDTSERLPFYTEDEIASKISAMKRKLKQRIKVVDYRELIYRMAIDYQNAAGRMKEIDKIGLNSPVALYNIHTLERPASLYHSQTNGALTDSQSIAVTWQYDSNTNTFKQFSLNTLEEVNEGKYDTNGNKISDGRRDKGQALYSWIDWVKKSNKIKWCGRSSEINDSSRQYIEIFHSDFTNSNDTYVMENLENDWQVRGMLFNRWGSTEIEGEIYYYPIIRVTKQKTFAILNQEASAWEKRLNNEYAIYFTDMLAFWNLYYKVDNDLTKDDVPEAYYAGLNYNSQMLTYFQSSQLQSAQSSYLKDMQSTMSNAIKTQDEKEQRYVMYQTNYINVLNTIKEKMDAYKQELIETRAKMRGTAYENYYASSVVDSVYTIVNNYITQQKANVNAGLNALSSTQSLYEGYVSQLSVLIKQFDNEQKNQQQNLVATSFQAWEDNGHWNPDYIRYNSTSAQITFLSPENMLFWIDFMDTFSELGKYKIASIGHRVKTINDTNVKAIFYRDVPNVLWIDPTSTIPKTSNLSYARLRLSDGLSNYFKISKQGKSAKDSLDELIYETTNYQETITLSSVPIYWFEPNQRIRVVDNDTGIRGEYIIKNFTYQLKYDGMMSLTAYRAADRLI